MDSADSWWWGCLGRAQTQWGVLWRMVATVQVWWIFSGSWMKNRTKTNKLQKSPNSVYVGKCLETVSCDWLLGKSSGVSTLQDANCKSESHWNCASPRSLIATTDPWAVVVLLCEHACRFPVTYGKSTHPLTSYWGYCHLKGDNKITTKAKKKKKKCYMNWELSKL